MDTDSPAPPSPPASSPSSPGTSIAWVLGFFAIGAASAAYPPIAVAGVLLTLILGLASPSRAPGREKALARAAMAFAIVGVTVGLGRFAVSKAMLGIVEGGQSAAAYSALWKLREVVIAEDGLRRIAAWDPDGDHVGSAALIGALTGAAPLRDSKRLDAPLLNYAFHDMKETAMGPAAKVEGYLLIVCLPMKSGWTARPDEPVDDERAERRFVAYAWPSETAQGMNTVFFADEHERLMVLDSPRGVPSPYLGANRPPACDAALGADKKPWKPWKGKKARRTLPGDSPS